MSSRLEIEWPGQPAPGGAPFVRLVDPECSVAALLSRAAGESTDQSGPSTAREIVWLILFAASAISLTPTLAYHKFIRASL